jgi:hypothetical protein
MLHQFIITVPHISADHLVQRLPYFALPSVSPNIKSFSIQSQLYILCPKYSNLLIAISTTNNSCCIKTPDGGQ